MPEYIDKLVILDQISELKSFYEKERKQSGDCLQEMNCVGAENGLTTLEDIISDIPTANVAPVAYGRWESKTNPNYPAYSHDKCSLCGWWNMRNALCYEKGNRSGHSLNYCPNCGAKMFSEDK